MRLALFVAILLTGTLSHARPWTSADGSRSFEAELVSYDDATNVVIVKRPNGSVTKFKAYSLSAADIAFLKSSSPAKTNAVPDQLPAPDGEEADRSQPVQVFILMGQSNMLGFGKVAGPGNEGTLEHATKEKNLYPYLVDDQGDWTTRKDVRNVRVMNFNDHVNDWLSAAGNKNIGPELGFGTVMGELLDAPVMVLKSCIGNRSLGWDLLPPGSERIEEGGKIYAGYKDSPDSWDKGSEPEPIAWYAGKQYDDDTGSAKKVLENLEKYYPGANGYKIAGFVFWQGDKDRYNPVHAGNYERNLVQLIRQLRTDFDAPGAKFVCATLGQTKKGTSGNEGDILNAQLAVDGDAGNYPEFKGNVASVYAHPLSQGGSSNGHYDGNAETYMNVGEALGQAMANLLAGE